jgi:hypothetical protein
MTGRGHWNNRRKRRWDDKKRRRWNGQEKGATFMTPFVVRITLAKQMFVQLWVRSINRPTFPVIF